jgi:hypothetical protein
VCVRARVSPPLHQVLNAWTNPAYFMNPLPSVSVFLCVSLHSVLGNGSVKTFPRQRIHATMKNCWDMSFSVWSVYQRRVCGSISLSLLGNTSAKTFPPQQGIVGDVFCVVRVVSKESRRVVIPKLIVLLSIRDGSELSDVPYVYKLDQKC